MLTIFTNTRFDFMKTRRMAYVISALLISFSIYEWIITGSNKYGVDFTGGVEVVVSFDKTIEISKLRNTLRSAGMPTAIVQSFEEGTNEFSIRMKGESTIDTNILIEAAVANIDGATATFLKEDFIGPTIGAEIRKAGLMALFAALAGMLIYISIRFEFRFAIGAVIALIHDILITMGIYVLCGGEISVAVVAALLTIVGYSLNDTIIVFDRIRENIALFHKTGAKGKALRGVKEMAELINVSINQTLSRTVLTSGTTLFVVITLYLVGGGALQDLALTLMIGIIVGTYSSIFIASPTVLALYRGKLPEKSQVVSNEQDSVRL